MHFTIQLHERMLLDEKASSDKYQSCYLCHELLHIKPGCWWLILAFYFSPFLVSFVCTFPWQYVRSSEIHEGIWSKHSWLQQGVFRGHSNEQDYKASSDFRFCVQLRQRAICWGVYSEKSFWMQLRPILKEFYFFCVWNQYLIVLAKKKNRSWPLCRRKNVIVTMIRVT